MAPPPWHATPVGQWHAKRNRPALPTSKAALYYWRSTFRSWPFTTEGVLHPTDRMCLPMLRPIYTQSCGKETPCGKSPSHTRVGPQALLDRVTVFRRAANDLEIQRARNSWNTAFAVHLPQSIHPPAIARWLTPNVMDHRVWPSTQASQILKLLRLGGVQDHSGHSRTSQPWTPQPPSWKATSQDFADTEPIHTNIELVGLLTILQNQTIFEISIRTISIRNLDLVLRLPISTARHDKLAISTPIQMMGFFQIPVRQLSREETIGVIETKGAMVSSETNWNEVQVARTAGWVFHVILLATSTFSPNANGTDTRTYFTLSTTTHNSRETNLTMWVKPTRIGHGSLIFHTRPDHQ